MFCYFKDCYSCFGGLKQDYMHPSPKILSFSHNIHWSISHSVWNRSIKDSVPTCQQHKPNFSRFQLQLQIFLGQIRCSRATNEDQRLALCKLLYLFGFVQEVQAGLTAGSFQAILNRFSTSMLDIWNFAVILHLQTAILHTTWNTI